MQTTLFVISSLKDGLVIGDDKRAKAVETPKEPEKLTADHHVEDHQPKEPKNPTADLPQEEAHAAKGNSELKAADVAANFQAKWLKDLKGDLTEEAKSESNQDLRRAQLTARANEKERVEEERGERKEQKKMQRRIRSPKAVLGGLKEMSLRRRENPTNQKVERTLWRPLRQVLRRQGLLPRRRRRLRLWLIREQLFPRPRPSQRHVPKERR